MNTTDPFIFSMCELLTHSSGQVNIRERASFALLFFFIYGHVFFFITVDYRQRESDDEI